MADNEEWTKVESTSSEEAEKVEEEVIQTENDILNNRIQEISDYAKKKPKEFAKLMSNLILSEMREEGVYKT